MDANPGYALSCLAEALKTASNAKNDPDMRERAQQKAAQWESVFSKMSDGSLHIGSRAPTGDPFWITLEVIGGGFATGRHMAALQAGDAPNISLLGLGGAQKLEELLHSGNYSIDYPESTAMLVVTWLLLQDRIEDAVSILQEISPWFDRLRFYPYPSDSCITPSTCICAHTLGDVRDNLMEVIRKNDDVGVKRNFQRMSLQRSVHILWPLEVECVQLLLETLEPASLEEGWPLQAFSETWKDRAASLLLKCRDARQHQVMGVTLNGKKTKETSKRGFPIMLRCLEKCVAMAQLPGCASDAVDIKGLSAKDVGTLRALLRGWVAKKQKPGSEQHKAYSDHKTDLVPGHSPADFATVLLNRTDGLDESSGLDRPDNFTQPVVQNDLDVTSQKEDSKKKASKKKDSKIATRTLPTSLLGKQVPNSIADKLHMCIIDTPQALIEKGLVSSSEMLGTLVPRISAEVTGACLQDPVLRRLHFALKASFAKRRGLMLLTMEHQVRINEIPWYKPIEEEVNKAGGTVERSLQTLREVVKMALQGFPQTIIPNKLIQTLRELAKSSKIDIEFVEEMPVDIFQGQFSPKFTSVSCLSARLLQGTLYETYYSLASDYDQLRQGVNKDYSLVRTCARRAGLREDWRYGSCGETGTVVEQQLLLTTHNLAPLFSALSLEDLDLSSMAKNCATWVYRTLAVAAEADGKERLMHTKNAAYAWRQLVFFVSMVGHTRGKGEAENVLDLVEVVCSALQPKPSDKKKQLNQKIYENLISPLRQAVDGTSPQLPFLGWTRQREHWFWK